MRWPEDAEKVDLPAAALSPAAYSGEEGIVDRVEKGDDVEDESMPADQGATQNRV